MNDPRFPAPVPAPVLTLGPKPPRKVALVLGSSTAARKSRSDEWGHRTGPEGEEEDGEAVVPASAPADDAATQAYDALDDLEEEDEEEDKAAPAPTTAAVDDAATQAYDAIDEDEEAEVGRPEDVLDERLVGAVEDLV